MVSNRNISRTGVFLTSKRNRGREMSGIETIGERSVGFMICIKKRSDIRQKRKEKERDVREHIILPK